MVGAQLLMVIPVPEMLSTRQYVMFDALFADENRMPAQLVPSAVGTNKMESLTVPIAVSVPLTARL
jgi:hypothetical protein